MNNLDKKFDHSKWRDGSRQELVPEEGETIEDAAKYMTEGLKYFKRYDLTFKKEDIEEIDGKFYITLIAKGLNGTDRGSTFLNG
jgi:hypothetical protein